jgi:hypothetical protein
LFRRLDIHEAHRRIAIHQRERFAIRAERENALGVEPVRGLEAMARLSCPGLKDLEAIHSAYAKPSAIRTESHDGSAPHGQLARKIGCCHMKDRHAVAFAATLQIPHGHPLFVRAQRDRRDLRTRP